MDQIRRLPFAARSSVGFYALIGFILLFTFLLSELVFTSNSVSHAQVACVVTSTEDSGPGTLREYIELANNSLSACTDSNTITFDPSLDGETIYLNSPLVIAGAGFPGPSDTLVTIDSEYDVTVAITNTGVLTRVFEIEFRETVTMRGFTVEGGNTPSSAGGALNIQDRADVTLDNMTFRNNAAFTGGVIRHRAQAQLTIINSTFENNSSTSEGGVIDAIGGNLDIQNTTFNNNKGQRGGVIAHRHVLTTHGNLTVNLVNNTFFANEGKEGGVIYLSSDSGNGATLINNTISENVVTLGALTASGADLTLVNTIVDNVFLDNVFGNVGEDLHACRFSDGGTLNAASKNNILEEWVDSTTPGNNGTPAVDPCASSAVATTSASLESFGSNGGSTQTLVPSSGSPALNAGDTDFCPATDQRGVARPQNGACDIGSVEVFLRTFEVNKSASAPVVTPGKRMTYTIEIVNTSPVPAEGITVIDSLPAGTTYVPGTISGGTPNDSNPSQLRWNVGTLDANASIVLNFAVDVNGSLAEGTEIVNTAQMQTTSASTEETYSGSVTTTVGALFADMIVVGNGVDIPSGSESTSEADHTDFPMGAVGAPVAGSRLFTIENRGTAPLTLTGLPVLTISGPGQANFRLIGQPSSSILDGESTSFEVAFEPIAQGIHTATISIENNDQADNPYVFNISGMACQNNITVTSTANDGPGSLRNAVEFLCENGTIDFASQLEGQTLTLTDQILLEKDLNIVSTVAMEISGGSATRIFEIQDANVSLNGLFLTRGSSTAMSGTIDEGGAIYVWNDASLTMRNSTVSESSAGRGGAISNSGNLVMLNSTLSDNSATVRGGGLYNLAVANLNNVTIYGNTGAVAAGGVDNPSPSSDLTITNSILAGSVNGKDCDATTPLTASSGNLIQDNSCTADVTGDPQVGPLQNNGGPSPTHALNGNSPAIDQGSTTCEVADQRGATRDSSCDIGAYEVLFADLTVSMTTNANPITSGDLLTYFIEVTNIGGGTAQNVSVTDAVPQNTTYASGSIDGGDSNDDSNPTNLSWDFAAIGINETVTMSFSVVLGQFEDGATFNNAVNVTSDSPESDFVNNSATFETTIDNDLPPVNSQPIIAFDQASYTAAEGDGTTTVTVTLSSAVGFSVTADVDVSNSETTFVDAAEEEMIPVVFEPGETSKAVEITIPDDTYYEGTRDVDLTLMNVSNAATTSASSAVLEVADNDTPPSLSIGDVTQSEGEGQTTFEFRVTLDRPAGVTVTVEYETTPSTATADIDYVSTSGTLVIPPNETVGTISVIVLGDSDDEEEAESFVVLLSNVQNADGVDLSGVGTIGGDTSIFMPMIMKQ